MKHPANIPEDVNLWFGPEVEGDNLGLWTAFVAEPVSGDDLQRILSPDIDQIFLTEKFHDWAWLKNNILLKLGTTILTIARYPVDLEEVLRLPYISSIHLVVRVDAPWIRFLRAGDEVSLGIPYSMITFMVCRGESTIPEDYEGDKL